MFSISEFVKHVGSELNIRGSHRRMSLPEVQDTGNLMNEFQGYDQSHEDFMSTSVRCRKTTDSAKLLAGAGYRRRSLRKALISGDVDPHERDRQFRLIATLRRQARARGVPVLCVDTRKKERLGHLPPSWG